MPQKRSNIADNLLIEIGKKIKEMRINSGYKSYENFAYDYDLDRKQYWRIENGTNITMNTLIKILKIHKTALQDFFNDTVFK